MAISAPRPTSRQDSFGLLKMIRQDSFGLPSPSFGLLTPGIGLHKAACVKAALEECKSALAVTTAIATANAAATAATAATAADVATTTKQHIKELQDLIINQCAEIKELKTNAAAAAAAAEKNRANKCAEMGGLVNLLSSSLTKVKELKTNAAAAAAAAEKNRANQCAEIKELKTNAAAAAAAAASSSVPVEQLTPLAMLRLRKRGEDVQRVVEARERMKKGLRDHAAAGSFKKLSGQEQAAWWCGMSRSLDLSGAL
jgi:hypothetical protein